MKIKMAEMTGTVHTHTHTLGNLINKKGITLVGLVVTIIVLLILGTVSIKLLTSSGIISKASYATNRYELKQEEEKIKLAVNSAIIDGNGVIIEESLTQELNAQFGENNWEYSETKTEDCFTIRIKKSERQHKIYTNGKVNQFVEIKEEELFTYNNQVVTGLSQKGKDIINSAEPGAEVKLVIPSTYKERKLTIICYNAFEDYNSITSVIIPEGITQLYNYSFRRCTSLTEVIMPNSLTSIGISAFAGCTFLEHITIPESVTYIGSSAFAGCESLNKVIIPNSIQTISFIAFNGCKSLKSIVLPDSIEILGWGAFLGCSSLESVNIPNKITNIGVQTFRNCTSLKSITIPDSVTEIGYLAFDGCSSLESVKMSNTIEIIDWQVFGGCKALKELEIPSSIINIGYSVFPLSTRVKINKTAEEIKNIPHTDGTLYYPWGNSERIYDINGDIVK